MTEVEAALRELMMRLMELERRLKKAQDDALFAQQMAKASNGGGGSGGGGTSLIRIWLPTGVAAGTFGTPANATDAVIAVRSSGGWTTSGGTTITALNCDTAAIGAGKAAWAVVREDNSYEIIVGDC